MSNAPKLAEVRTLATSNRRDIPATLRIIANQIERGDNGNVECVTLVCRGEGIEVCHLGEGEAEQALINLMFGRHQLESSMLRRIAEG